MDKNLQTDIDTLREAVKKLHYFSLGNVGTTKVNLAKIGHGALETLDRIVARIPEPVKICKTCAHAEGDFSCCSCKAPDGELEKAVDEKYKAEVKKAICIYTYAG